MKRVLVISDVHGDFDTMEKILEKNNQVDLKIFLGDFQANKYLESELAKKFDLVVSGNTDNYGISPKDILVEIEGINIFLTHGDKYFSFKEYVSKKKLIIDAKKYDINLVMHGHDHKASITKIDNITIFNPGSPSYPRFGSKKAYGILEIDSGKILNIKNIFI